MFRIQSQMFGFGRNAAEWQIYANDLQGKVMGTTYAKTGKFWICHIDKGWWASGF